MNNFQIFPVCFSTEFWGQIGDTSVLLVKLYAFFRPAAQLLPFSGPNKRDAKYFCLTALIPYNINERRLSDGRNVNPNTRTG